MGSSFGQTMACYCRASKAAPLLLSLQGWLLRKLQEAAQVAAPKRVRWAEGADLEQVLVFQVSASPQPCMIFFIIIVIYNSNVYLFCLQ